DVLVLKSFRIGFCCCGFAASGCLSFFGLAACLQFADESFHTLRCRTHGLGTIYVCGTCSPYSLVFCCDSFITSSLGGSLVFTDSFLFVLPVLLVGDRLAFMNLAGRRIV